MLLGTAGVIRCMHAEDFEGRNLPPMLQKLGSFSGNNNARDFERSVKLPVAAGWHHKFFCEESRGLGTTSPTRKGACMGDNSHEGKGGL